MATVHLPFFQEFFELFEKNSIKSWRVRDFCGAMFHDQNLQDPQMQKKLYQGVMILFKHGYLTRECSIQSRRIYVYSETQKLRDHVQSIKHEKIELTLLSELDDIKQFQDSKIIEDELIKHLVNKNIFIKETLLEYTKRIRFDLTNSNIKINLIKTILSDLKSNSRKLN